jgi:FtsP/CotA-like multicopper oxidase with cupredoxin domain
MRGIFLPSNASKARVKAAENARRNRVEIVRELSWGRISRRDLIRMGVFTGAGLLAPIGGLNPFVSSAFADRGMPRSPLFGCQPFTQPMPRFDVLARNPNPMTFLNPAPTAEANRTAQVLNPGFGLPPGTLGPVEGRPGDVVDFKTGRVIEAHPEWRHQRFAEFLPQIAVEAVQAGARTNTVCDMQISQSLYDFEFGNSTFNTSSIPLKFHPGMPVQRLNCVWTFNGTIPPKLVQGRYGEPILFRHRNGLPFNRRENEGFGIHTISTHEHNGHHGAENDGFTGAFFFPGQFYDYHWPIVLAGHFSVNTGATDPRASSPADDGTLHFVRGDWRETMSTHWFHDHMFSFTSQNVYKGNAAMFNIYSGLDRGAEDIVEDVLFPDGTHGPVNLRLPSGHPDDHNGKTWGLLDYDVNLMLADKAFDSDGQLIMDIFNFDGFVGDVMTVNLAYKPYMNVERRKYRFRILNASVSRFFKLALANASGVPQQITQIANDGNLLPNPVTLMELDEQGIAERYDIVIDFSRYVIGDRLHLVNLADHADPVDGKLTGTKPVRDLTVAQALSGVSLDPCVGRILEFRVLRNPARPDNSQVPAALIPNPDLSSIPVARVRTFEFGRDGIQERVADPAFGGPWGISTNGGQTLNADYSRISAAPRFGSREVWNLVNDGGGWDHPIHIHFEEGQILARNGSLANVPPWERGRKDVYRLHPGGSLTITMQFRDWGGMFMEHCHNTTHEDNAMLLRWEINDAGDPFLAPLPTPLPSPTGVTFENPFEIIP